MEPDGSPQRPLGMHLQPAVRPSLANEKGPSRPPPGLGGFSHPAPSEAPNPLPPGTDSSFMKPVMPFGLPDSSLPRSRPVIPPVQPLMLSGSVETATPAKPSSLGVASLPADPHGALPSNIPKLSPPLPPQPPPLPPQQPPLPPPLPPQPPPPAPGAPKPVFFDLAPKPSLPPANDPGFIPPLPPSSDSNSTKKHPKSVSPTNQAKVPPRAAPTVGYPSPLQLSEHAPKIRYPPDEPNVSVGYLTSLTLHRLTFSLSFPQGLFTLISRLDADTMHQVLVEFVQRLPL